LDLTETEDLMARLSINVDHVATLREARKTFEPDPVAAAMIAELAGACGITVHLRGDRRHIQPRDLRLLRLVVKTRLNLEMACTEEMIGVALEVRPDQVTLVPERREEVSTEGGLNVVAMSDGVSKAVSKLHGRGISVSLFVDPDIGQIRAAAESGADIIEIHTGEYAAARSEGGREKELEKIKAAALAGRELGLEVHAGHGLTYQNVRRIAEIPQIEELSIGHSIIAKAVLVGLDRAVRDMIELIKD